MRRVLWLLAAGVVVVAAVWWLAGLRGEVTATIAGYSIDAPTPIAAIVLAAVLLVLHLLLRGISALLHFPRNWRRWRQQRRRRDGDIAVTRSLVALAAGDQHGAKNQAQRARKLLGDTPQTLLLAAEAGRLAGNDGEAEALYKRLAERADAAFLGLRGLFRQAMAREDWAGAAVLAARAEAAQPGANWLRGERALLAVRTRNWAQALSLAGPEAPRLAYATAAAEAEADPQRAIKLAKRAWKDDPGFAPAALAYAKRLRAGGRESRALAVIRTAWKASPHPDLAQFALEPASTDLARVKAAEQLAATSPDHAESHFLLARVSLQAGLTGEARRHAEAARRGGLNQKRLWLLIAELEAREHGESEAGHAAQRDALRHAATAEPDPVWRCDSCGKTQAGWQAACPDCHTPGRIVWGGATRLALPAG
jgi:HemY protein